MDRKWISYLRRLEFKIELLFDPEQRLYCATRNVTIEDLLEMDSYSAANAFVTGQLDVQGDIVAAVHFFMNGRHSTLASLWHSVAARLRHVGGALQSRSAAIGDVQFHYDRSNEFYAEFLDSRMQYSSAEYNDPHDFLEDAQLEKLEQVCLTFEASRPGDRFLDVGCGWGGPGGPRCRTF